MQIAFNKKVGSVFFLICSLCFFFIGTITVLDIVGAFHTTHAIVWRLIPLAGINVLIGYGFLIREAWLESAFAINFISMGLIAALSALVGSMQMALLVGVALNALLFMFLRLNRSALHTFPYSFMRMLLFAVLWLTAVWQLVYTFLT